MNHEVNGEELAKLILTYDFVIDGTRLLEMPSIKLQRVIKQIEPSIIPEKMSDSEMVQEILLCIINHQSQLDTNLYLLLFIIYHRKSFTVNDINMQLFDPLNQPIEENPRLNCNFFPSITSTFEQTGELLPNLLIPSNSKPHYHTVYKPLPIKPLQKLVTEDEVQKERSIETIQNQENNNEIPTNSYIRRSHNRMGVFGYLVF